MSIPSEQQVKDKLGITDFRNMSKDKITSFISMIPEVDNEIVIKILEKFPELSKIMIEQMKEICCDVLAQNNSSTQETYKAYNRVLDDLSFMLKQDSISPEDQKYIINKQIEIADKISTKDTENKNFLLSVLGGLGALVLLIIGGILGIKSTDKSNHKNTLS